MLKINTHVKMNPSEVANQHGMVSRKQPCTSSCHKALAAKNLFFLQNKTKGGFVFMALPKSVSAAPGICKDEKMCNWGGLRCLINTVGSLRGENSYMAPNATNCKRALRCQASFVPNVQSKYLALNQLLYRKFNLLTFLRLPML